MALFWSLLTVASTLYLLDFCNLLGYSFTANPEEAKSDEALKLQGAPDLHIQVV